VENRLVATEDVAKPAEPVAFPRSFVTDKLVTGAKVALSMDDPGILAWRVVPFERVSSRETTPVPRLLPVTDKLVSVSDPVKAETVYSQAISAVLTGGEGPAAAENVSARPDSAPTVRGIKSASAAVPFPVVAVLSAMLLNRTLPTEQEKPAAV
jgi:hypothetical protein